MSDFIDNHDKQKAPYAFIQWKGTDVCMDFECVCGGRCHFDGFGLYTVRCDHCGAAWEMPCYVTPRLANDPSGN